MLSPAELKRLASDTGCSVDDDCLTCPLDECILITGKVGTRTLEKRKRDETIKQMSMTASPKEIARELGVSLRTVERALKRGLNE